MNGQQTLVCSVYRCSKKEGMYIYVDKKQDIAVLPEALKQRVGQLQLAMTLLLTPEKKLARAQANDVMNAIASQGFYLQMPPSPGAEAQAAMAAISEANQFLEK